MSTQIAEQVGKTASRTPRPRVPRAPRGPRPRPAAASSPGTLVWMGFRQPAAPAARQRAAARQQTTSARQQVAAARPPAPAAQSESVPRQQLAAARPRHRPAHARPADPAIGLDEVVRLLLAPGAAYFVGALLAAMGIMLVVGLWLG